MRDTQAAQAHYLAQQAQANGHFALPQPYEGFPHGAEANDPAAHTQLMDLLQSIHQGPGPQQNAFAAFSGPHSEAFAAAPFHHGEEQAPLHSAATGMVTDYRGGSTGSTSFSVDGNWDDTEFAFTPLVSPAMTPLSALLSPQIVALKNGAGQHVSPAEVFSPLTSPALQPQDAQMNTDAMDSPHLHHLSEQASNMGLEGFQLPRALGTDNGMGVPAAGPSSTGRGRGASRTAPKSRPSPIIKPTGRPTKSSQPATPVDEVMRSTPSPIDIDVNMAVAAQQQAAGHLDMMPPPPLPPHASVPATPSSLMNLGSDIGLDMSQGGSSSNTSPILGPKRGKKQSKNGQKLSRNSVEFAPLPAPVVAPEDRRNSHRAAEQRRRDSLKLCFEELRPLLPHIPPEEDEEALAAKRPGEGNVAGQRTSGVDPLHPNKGVSKVALLRKSNAYIQALEKRIRARDEVMRKMKDKYDIPEDELRITDWEENWPWNGQPGDEGHSPYSQAAIEAQAAANGDLNGVKRANTSGIVTRNKSKRSGQTSQPQQQLIETDVQ